MIKKVLKIPLKDILGLFKFIIIIIPAIIYKYYLKIRKLHIWLICETEFTARDNGLVFFEYMVNNHSEIKTYYAINKKSNDFKNVSQYSNVIQWASLKHYLIYMCCEKNVSSHKEGNPNHPLFTVLHLYLNLFNNRIFIQHGVLYQNFEMFHYKNTKFKMFVCGAKPEYEFVKKKYGYQNGEVRYTGLARFDKLHDSFENKKDKFILYMPTWRRWLDNEEDLKKSLYYKKIDELINNEQLEQFLISNNIDFYFCPHTSIKSSIELYHSKIKKIKIIDNNSANIQSLLKNCSILITDFSSVHTDVAYLKKPVIYYQYDYNDFMEKHIGKQCYDTYFDFKEDAFGPVTDDLSEIINYLKYFVNNQFIIQDKYLNRISNFFELYDNNNCERIFNEINNC